MAELDKSAHFNRWRDRALIEKAGLAIGLLCVTLAFPAWPVSPIVFLVMTLATLAGARVRPLLWLAALLAPMGFIAFGAASLLVQIDTTGVSLAPGGGAAAAAVAMRALAGISCLLFLALTTPATDLIGGMRRIGLPAEVADIALLTYRFVFDIGAVAGAMHAAQAARLGHHGIGRWRRSLGLLIANLLPRAFDRARRMEVGLAARGWNGDFRVLADRPKPSAKRLAGIALVEIAIVVVGVFGS